MSKRPLKVRRLMIAGVVAAVAAASLVLVPPQWKVRRVTACTHSSPSRTPADVFRPQQLRTRKQRPGIRPRHQRQSAPERPGTRATQPNAYVVSSIDETIRVISG
jgi:hypothetical protein